MCLERWDNRGRTINIPPWHMTHTSHWGQAWLHLPQPSYLLPEKKKKKKMWWEMGASSQRSTYGYVPKTITRWRIYCKEQNGSFEVITGRASSIPFFLGLNSRIQRQLLSAGCISHSPRCFYGFHKVPDHLRSRCCIGGKRRLPRGNGIWVGSWVMSSVSHPEEESKVGAGGGELPFERPNRWQPVALVAGEGGALCCSYNPATMVF